MSPKRHATPEEIAERRSLAMCGADRMAVDMLSPDMDVEISERAVVREIFNLVMEKGTG